MNTWVMQVKHTDADGETTWESVGPTCTCRQKKCECAPYLYDTEHQVRRALRMWYGPTAKVLGLVRVAKIKLPHNTGEQS